MRSLGEDAERLKANTTSIRSKIASMQAVDRMNLKAQKQVEKKPEEDEDNEGVD